MNDVDFRTFQMSRSVYDSMTLSLLKVLHSDKGLEIQFLESKLDNDLFFILQLRDHRSTTNPLGSGRSGFLGENA